MELIPHDEIKPSNTFNFAPMIDFLFLMLALFACLAVSRAALYDSTIELVQLKPEKDATPLKAKQIHQINLTITKEGQFKWITDYHEYPMDSVLAIQEELLRQYSTGAIPQNKEQTEVLLHIDKKAPWEPIANVIFAVKEVGFSAHPVYDTP
jgi:biopolymer transport protein ExbD